MRLKYETGIATLIQFFTISLLSFVGNLGSIISTCRSKDGECVGNALPSMILFILTAGWFGLIWVVGFTAQDSRKKRLAQLLIAAEGVTILGSIAVLKFHAGIIGLAGSLFNIGLSLWIILLAYRLMKSRGGRIVVKQRARKHKTPTIGL